MTKKALITGVTGQDGSYLAEHLLSKGYQVVGTTRNTHTLPNIIKSLDKENFKIVNWDTANPDQFRQIMKWYKPNEIYNLAALSTGVGMYNNPADIGYINGQSVVEILNSIYEIDRGIKFFQASSSEMYRGSQITPQSEDTEPAAKSPYGIAKLYAHLMTKMFREKLGIFACSAILYNHESPRRASDFVTQKVVNSAVKIKLGIESNLKLGDINAKRDWGFAGDYVRAMHLMLEAKSPNDYIVATGKLHSVKELCDIAFKHLGLDYRKYVVDGELEPRKDGEVELVGNTKKIKSELKWEPSMDFDSMIRYMVDTELKKIINPLSTNQITK